MAVVQTSQPSTSELTTADYDLCGDAIDNPTKGSANIDLTGLTIGAYRDFTLNATGLGWISKTGYTMLGVREGHDIQDIWSDPGEVDKESGIWVSASEQTDTSQDPYLSVTYTTGGTATDAMSFGTEF